MAVEVRGPQGEEGQSVIEFMLMLPLIVGLAMILVRIQTAIQISINNQQYARAQALMLAYNSPVYPNLSLRESDVTGKNYNQMVIGVSENTTDSTQLSDEGGGGGNITPKAARHYVARRKGVPDRAEAEPSERALVRIHDTVTLCTQTNVVKAAGGSEQPVLKLKRVGPGLFRADGSSNIGEGTKFEYCSSPLDYKSASGGDGA
jgi:hypothetical protein